MLRIQINNDFSTLAKYLAQAVTGLMQDLIDFSKGKMHKMLTQFASLIIKGAAGHDRDVRLFDQAFGKD
jgi:hypothetical protein